MEKINKNAKVNGRKTHISIANLPIDNKNISLSNNPPKKKCRGCSRRKSG